MAKQTVQIAEKAQFLFKPYRFKGLYGGRGSAKSTSVATALVLICTSRQTRVLCCREIQKSMRASVYQLIQDTIERLNLTEYYIFTRESIRHRSNGSAFLFFGLKSNPDAIKSIEGLDIVWIEEADRCSAVSLQLLTPTMRKRGSEIWATWNRQFKTDPIDELFLGESPPPRSKAVQMNWRDNPWFPDVLYDEMMWLKAKDYDKYLHVWEGQPVMRSAARVFPTFAVDDLDHQVEKFQIPPRFGADWGMRDPTVLVKAHCWKRTLYISREVYKVGATIDEIPSLFAGHDTRVRKRWKNPFNHQGIPSVLKANIIGDSASPQIIRHLHDRGFKIKAAKKGANSIEEGIQFMQSMDIVVHPSCKHVIDELTYYSYKIDSQTDEILPELEDKDNHTIDSIRYAVETLRRSKSIQQVGVANQTVDL